MKKRFIYKIIFFLLVLSFSLKTFEITYADMELKDVKNGVIRILTDDGMDAYQGSGFAIGIQGKPVTYIVTNYHVVENMVNIHLYLDDYKQYPLEVTDIVFVENDIALVKLSEPLNFLQPLIIETEDEAESGDKIYALGFPAISDILDDSFTGYPEDITVTSGIISKISKYNNSRFYQIDATISGGNSGGPLINEKGHVIGINSFATVDSYGQVASGYNGSYLLDRLIKELDSNNIPYTKSEDILIEVPVASIIPEEPTEVPTEKTTEAPTEVPTKEPTRPDIDINASNDQNKSINPLYIFIVAIAALLVLVAIVLLVIMVTRKSHRLPAQPIIPPMEKPVIKKPQIFGVTGYHGGQVFLVEGMMTFGRNPSSKIPYPENHRGISGNHCILQYDSQGELFILTDLGSSYGTFLESGQMIQKNSKVALSAGDKFYLADTNELFEVRLSL